MRSDGLMWHQLFKLSPTSTLSLQSQLRESLVKAILDGQIPIETPLPSSRELARQLGVARNTVVLAYQHLIDEKYLLARERKGYYVNPEILTGRVRTAADNRSGRDDAANQTHQVDAKNEPDWSNLVSLELERQRNIQKPRDWQNYDYPFVYGQVDPSLFPVNDWRESCRLSLHVGAIRQWTRDQVDNDDDLLVEQILNRVLPRRGVWASPDQILITTGAQNGLYLAAQLLLNRSHGKSATVGVEDPCYADARNMFALFTDSCEAFPVGEQGVEFDNRLRSCDLLYVTPSHQCPTTSTLPLERRRELLDRAVEDDFLILEDDYESELNFVGEPTPALKSLDRNNRVIYIGSLSKTLAPGLRIGFMVASPELIKKARALRRLMYRHPPTNTQRTVGHFLALGHHDSVILKLSQVFKERWRVMDQALSSHLMMSSTAPSFGGSSFWVGLPAGVSAAELEARAAEQSIVINAGDNYFADENGPRNYFRLGFSSIATDRIEPGIQKLASIVESMKAESNP